MVQTDITIVAVSKGANVNSYEVTVTFGTPETVAHLFLKGTEMIASFWDS